MSYVRQRIRVCRVKNEGALINNNNNNNYNNDNNNHVDIFQGPRYTYR